MACLLASPLCPTIVESDPVTWFYDGLPFPFPQITGFAKAALLLLLLLLNRFSRVRLCATP